MTPDLVNNRILGACQPEILPKLYQLGRIIPFDRGRCLVAAGALSTELIFPLNGVLAERLSSGLLTSLIGTEGVVCGEYPLSDAATLHEVAAVTPGEALLVDVKRIKEAGDFPELLDWIPRFQRYLISHIASNYESAAKSNIEQRVALLVLMLADRGCHQPSIRLTHDEIARFLGVRRPGVTVAIHMLEGHHLVSAHRTMIEIKDLEKLREFVRIYGRAEADYERLMGSRFALDELAPPIPRVKLPKPLRASPNLLKNEEAIAQEVSVDQAERLRRLEGMFDFN